MTDDLQNVIQFSESKLFSLSKFLLVAVFGLGGWFTSLEMRQRDRDQIIKVHERKIEKLTSDYNALNLLIATDVSTIKTQLNTIINDVRELKKSNNELDHKN